MKRLDPAKRWAADDDHDQHLKLAWAKARFHYRPDGGLSSQQYTDQAVEAADWHWSKMTKRERMRSRRTVSIQSLLTEPASPGFVDSVIAAAEVSFLMEKLSPVERVVVLAIMSSGRSADEVASQLGVTSMVVRNIKRRAVAKARRPMS